MIRQRKRSELRNLEKEYKRITKSELFRRLMTSDEFKNLGNEDVDMLKSLTHKDSQLQAKFNLGILLISKVKSIEERIKYLKSL